MKIIYLHGFCSSGQSFKARVLRENLPRHEIISPDLPDAPLDAIRFIEDMLSIGPDLITGSSLGGFYSLYFGIVHKIPAVMINPALDPWEKLSYAIGMHKRLYSDNLFEFRMEYMDQLKEIDRRINESTCDQNLLHFLLATDDALFDHNKVPQRYPEAATIEFFDGVAHDFIGFEKTLPYYQNIVKSL